MNHVPRKEFCIKEKEFSVCHGRCHLLLMTIAMLLSTTLTNAEVKVPHVISDHMVLQRGRPISIWGTAAPT
ncbi:MAG TPA: hypothetical protein VIS99_14005, partial [Terrimicrobiaceae bacterium]